MEGRAGRQESESPVSPDPAQSLAHRKMHPAQGTKDNQNKRTHGIRKWVLREAEQGAQSLQKQ